MMNASMLILMRLLSDSTGQSEDRNTQHWAEMFIGSLRDELDNPVPEVKRATGADFQFQSPLVPAFVSKLVNEKVPKIWSGKWFLNFFRHLEFFKGEKCQTDDWIEFKESFIWKEEKNRDGVDFFFALLRFWVAKEKIKVGQNICCQNSHQSN